MARTPLKNVRSKHRLKNPVQKMLWYSKRCFDELEKRLSNPTQELAVPVVVKQEVEESSEEVAVQLIAKDELVKNKLNDQETVAVAVKDEAGGSLGQYLGVIVGKINTKKKQSLESEFRNWLLSFEHPKEYIKMRTKDDVRMVFCAIHFRPNMNLFCGNCSNARSQEIDNVREEFQRLFGIRTHGDILYKVHHDGRKIVMEAASWKEILEDKLNTTQFP